ncbi:CvpA family protein [Pontixanthobacter aestiaquae]|uniref:CvpA family protein n=1 Tax=Pontixanthobacter aestiaquae TaxID=1509367 RepID=A0A844Z9B3_9SPHN|nr:CvpA family protein [Pontixanthobacter aestiaquae]MDN3645417.1 CvpA family protein [Pontixanthobacter aestiaquae]MXO83583.1 CvpA family protein [Pontixanthobacter aestiaquae]
MTGFDFIVLIIVGVAAVGGFLRGLVQEMLSLAAWLLAIFAIHYLHTPLYQALGEYLEYNTAVAILAFALLLLIPYAGMKLIAGRAGEASRASLLGPIDRVLGFGFGAIKGALIVVVAFSVLVLGYDAAWGVAGRPAWITTARTYPVVNAGADGLVQMIQERRSTLRAEEAEEPN